MSWVFVGVVVVFSALSGCFPGITGRVDVRADTKDLAGGRASQSATASAAATASAPPTTAASSSAGLSEDDLAKIGKVVEKSMPTPVQTATADPIPMQKPKMKSLNRLGDGLYEATGYGDGLSASGSVRALVRNQAVGRDGKLVLWMTAEAYAGAYEFKQDPDDVTESSYALRIGVKEETFAADVTGTASPAVVIDLAGKVFRLDPAQNIFSFSYFKLTGGWYPEQDEADAASRIVAWGKRMALLYIPGPGGTKGWYRWADPAEPKEPRWDWGGMATKFTDDPPESLVYVPATGSPPIAWFSIISAGKQTLVEERFALAAR